MEAVVVEEDAGGGIDVWAGVFCLRKGVLVGLRKREGGEKEC